MALRALLAGGTGKFDGATLGLLHGPDHGPPRPVGVPVLVAADGPKGRAVAAEVGDGVFATKGRLGQEPLDPREVLDAMGWLPAMIYHSAYLAGHVDRLPGGELFRDAVEAVPAERRHLALHEGHMVALNPRDRHIPVEALHGVLARSATVGDTAAVADHLRELAARGVSEVAVHIPVADAEQQLHRLAHAAKGIADPGPLGPRPS